MRKTLQNSWIDDIIRQNNKVKTMFLKTFLLLFIIFSCISFFIYGEAIGRIVRLSGAVKIDAFGKEAFIDALDGDLLYTNTVLYFSAGCNAIILLREKRLTIISTSLSPLTVRYEENTPIVFSHYYIKVKDLLKIYPRYSEKTNYFPGSIWQIVSEVIRNLFDNVSDEDNYSTKEHPPEKDIDWMIDMDAYKLKKAWDRFRNQDFENMLLALLSIEDPVKLEFPCGGLEFLIGVCYLKSGEYEKAKEQFIISEQVVKLKEKEYQLSYFYHPLLYLSGVLSYITGDYIMACSYLQSYLEYAEPGNIEISISAYSLFIDACILLDYLEKAEKVLTKTIAVCTNDLLKKELEKLLAYLYSYEANS